VGTKRRRRQEEKKRRHRTGRASEELRVEQSADRRQADEENLPTMTLDEFRRVRDDFFASIPTQLETLKEQLIEAMSPFDAFDILTNLLIANMRRNLTPSVRFSGSRLWRLICMPRSVST
jgi:hypothetical protein